MGIPNRLYNIAKSQLDKAVERWQEIDTKAQQEIDSYMASHIDTNQQSSWERALNKINAGAAESELRPASANIDDKELQPEPDLAALEAKIAAGSVQQTRSTSMSPQLSSTQAQERTRALIGAYKMLGLEPGADWAKVREAHTTLRERASPERFGEGSPEQETAVSIQRRIDAAYMMISGALAPSGDRFDRLEL